jgi:hypothetical protein
MVAESRLRIVSTDDDAILLAIAVPFDLYSSVKLLYKCYPEKMLIVMNIIRKRKIILIKVF